MSDRKFSQQDHNNNNVSFNISWPFVSLTGAIWAGWWDLATEGLFVDVNNGTMNLSSTNYSPWSPGEPNGDTRENCIVSWPGGAWNDQSCNNQYCVACDVGE